MNPDPGMLDNLVIPCFHCAAVSLSHVVGLSILCLLFLFYEGMKKSGSCSMFLLRMLIRISCAGVKAILKRDLFCLHR